MRKPPLVTEQELEQVVAQAKAFYQGAGGQVNATHLAIAYSAWLFYQESKKLTRVTNILLGVTIVLALLTVYDIIRRLIGN